MPCSYGGGDRCNLPIVKCVVVGDTAVGKTKLISVLTQGARLTVDQLFVNHVPTVWAIDRYRKDPTLQARAVRDIDGVKVFVQLWDTFGDHEKDRTYGYQKANVVLLCFNIASFKSYQHVKSKWYPEIRAFCPNTPIILLGCKNDVRYLNQDPEFIQYWKSKLLYSKKIDENKLISREHGRLMAQEIGAFCYYETSAYTLYGMDFLFENIGRAGLLARRNEQLFVKRWKSVNPPQVQPPYCPRKPSPPELRPPPPSTYRQDIDNLVADDYGADFSFLIGQARFRVQRLILVATSQYFRELFLSLDSNLNSMELPSLGKLGLDLAEKVLMFHYTGYLNMEQKEILMNYKDIKNIIRVEELKDLVLSKTSDEFNKIRDFIWEKHLCSLKDGLYELGIKHKYFADVVFEVDDGVCLAHRGILMARCEVMKNMFSTNFIEKSCEVIQFPGTTMDVFDTVLEYLYTDRITERLTCANALRVIILANRLCLFRLINVVEVAMILKFTDFIDSEQPIPSLLIHYLEQCEMHNALQLYQFCHYHIATNYHNISIFSADELDTLSQDTKDDLARCRWPPLEVHRELMLYHEVQRQKAREARRDKKSTFLKRAKESVFGLYGRDTTANRILDVSEPDSDLEDRLENNVIYANDIELYQGSFGKNLYFFEDDVAEDRKHAVINAVGNMENNFEDMFIEVKCFGDNWYGLVRKDGPEIFV